jgi:hypothetical protein
VRNARYRHPMQRRTLGRDVPLNIPKHHTTRIPFRIVAYVWV